MENANIYNTIKEGQVKGPNTLHLALKMLHECQLLPWECNLVISEIGTHSTPTLFSTQGV